MVELFSKEQFEAALDELPDEWEITPLGVVQGNYAYRVNFGNPDAHIMIYSSVAPNGQSRGDGEDSIRAWLVTPEGQPIGGKSQRWVTRKRGWQGRMIDMLARIVLIGRWIQPCPVCKVAVRVAVRGDKVYLFCSQDAANKDIPGHKRHLPFMCLDKETGERTS